MPRRLSHHILAALVSLALALGGGWVFSHSIPTQVADPSGGGSNGG